MGKEWSLFAPLWQGPSRPGTWYSLLPCLTTPGFTYFFTFQVVEVTRVPELLHVALYLSSLAHTLPFSRMSRMSPSGLHDRILFIFQNLAQLSPPQKKTFFFFSNPPSTPGLCSVASLSCCSFQAVTMCFSSYLSPLLGCDSLKEQTVFYPFSVHAAHRKRTGI